MFVAERFLSGLVKVNGNHPVSTDGGTWYPSITITRRRFILKITEPKKCIIIVSLIRSLFTQRISDQKIERTKDSIGIMLITMVITEN
jgi:hypothetical protein